MKMFLPKTNFLLFFFICVQHFLIAQHDTIQANLLLEQAIDLHYEGDYEAARKPFLKVLDLRKKYFEETHAKLEVLYIWLGDNEQGLRNSKKALDYYAKGLALAIEREGEESIRIADYYIEMGNTYDQLYDLKNAKKYYNKALLINKNIFGAESDIVGAIYMNMGYGQTKTGNYQDAGRLYKKAYEIFQKASKPNSKDFYRIYINQCNLLYKMGDYDRALLFGEKALKIKLMHYDTLHPGVAKYFSNIGNIYQAKGMYEEALPYQKMALRIATETRGKDHPDTAGEMGYLGTLYEYTNQLNKALALHKKAVRIKEKSLPPTHPYLVAAYEDIARVYKAKKELDKALKFYENALSKYQNAVFVPQHLVAGTLGEMAEIYFEKGALDQALRLVQEAIKNLAKDYAFVENDLYENPTLVFIQAEEVFLNLLRYKTTFLQARYEKGKQQIDLEEALKSSELAIEVIEKIRRSYLSESSVQFLNDNTSSVYEKAIEQAFELFLLTQDRNYLYKAFNFSEKSKASILWQSLHDQYALKASGIPKEQLDSLRTMELEIGDLKEQALGENSAAKRKKIEEQILDLKLVYEKKIFGFEKYNSQYYQLKYPSRNVDLASIKAGIPNSKTALVEYFYSQKHLYIFVLSQEELKGFRNPIPNDFSEKILALRNNDIYSIALEEKKGLTDMESLSDLYNFTIAPIQASLEGIENLVIVPHGILQYLSFESLAAPSSNTDFRQLDYLLKKYSIQYHWSASLWANAPKSNPSWSLDFLGFAPGFENPKRTTSDLNAPFSFRKNLSPLRHSLPELEGANQFFAGEIYSASQATESRFLEMAPKSKIIHLATHAIANDLYPMQSGLLFSEQGDTLEDGFLQNVEIYNLKLSAELALMSACNTGYGQFSEGEGIMSLGRAFLYAGCKSVIMSLWLANDESTSTIVQHFYKYADLGFSKNEALRKAKIDYLDQADPLTAHPYFWANLVAVGDMKPLQGIASGSRTWMAFLGLGMLLIGGLWWRGKLA